MQYDQLDSEHVGLFAALLELENNPTDQAVVDSLQSLMRDHFYYEEAQFCDSLDLPWDYCSMHKRKHVLFSARFERLAAPVDVSEVKWAQDWLAQHIKNTDFGYKGHLKHAVPEPYVWEQTFATDVSPILYMGNAFDSLLTRVVAVQPVGRRARRPVRPDPGGFPGTGQPAEARHPHPVHEGALRIRGAAVLRHPQL